MSISATISASYDDCAIQDKCPDAVERADAAKGPLIDAIGKVFAGNALGALKQVIKEVPKINKAKRLQAEHDRGEHDHTMGHGSKSNSD